MSRKRIPQIRKTAYHEAGHVILNILARIFEKLPERVYIGFGPSTDEGGKNGILER